MPEGVAPDAVLHRDALYRRALAVVDIAATALALVVVGDGHLAPAHASALPLVVFLCYAEGLYRRDEHLLGKSTLNEVPALLHVATLLTLLVWFSEGLSSEGSFGREEAVSFYILLVVLMGVMRALARSGVRRLAPEERCLVVGDADSARTLGRKLRESFSLKATVVGRVPLEPEFAASDANGDAHLGGRADLGGHARLPAQAPLGDIESLGLILVEHDIHRVIVVPSGPDAERSLHVIRTVRSLGARVSVLPRMFEVVGSAFDFDDVDGTIFVGLHQSRLSRSSNLLKRCCDVVGSCIGLLLLWPVLAAFALAIKLTSPGPILFRQQRIGRRGIEFDMLKFRTMVDGADAKKNDLLGLNEADGLFKIVDDPRVTRVGRFLRRRSLDELPQLWNVLSGQMSLVGPRPLVPEDDARVWGWQRDRLHLVPGMTGVWQILGSTRVPLHEMVKLDYLYGVNWSLWVDIKILLRTILYVIRARSS